MASIHMKTLTSEEKRAISISIQVLERTLSEEEVKLHGLYAQFGMQLRADRLLHAVKSSDLK